MWGNLQGWLISMVLLIGSGAMFYHLATPPVESQPTNLIPLAHEEIQLPMEAKLVVPPPTNSRDAGSSYRQAVIRYQSNPKPYLDPIHAKLEELSALPLLLDGRDCGRMNLYEAKPEELVNYDLEHPSLNALANIANAANTVGLGLMLDEKYDAAKPYFEAAFAAGRHLFNERVTWQEMSVGLRMMSDGAQNLAKLADRTQQGAKADVLRKFQDGVDKYHATLQESVASPLSNPVEGYGSKYAGDVFAVAKDPNAERVWRVLAIMHLGRYRWNVADDRKGDQFWADRELSLLANSLDSKNADHTIVTAIRSAQGLTVEQQRISAAAQ